MNATMTPKILSIFLVLLVTMSDIYADNKKQLVLVTSTENKILELSKKTVRRLYLGQPILIDGSNINVLSNQSDNYLHEVFLQKIMYMSARTYHRQVVSRLLNRGGKALPVIDNHEKITELIINDKNTISYMWLSIVKHHPGIKVIQILWQGELD